MIKRIFWSIFAAAAASLGIGIAAFAGLDGLPLLAVAGVVFLLSVIFASLAARRIVRPLNELDPQNPTGASRYSELSPLMMRLARQDDLIRRQMDDLRRSQEEFSAITDNMAEGFVLIGADLSLLSYNSSAERIIRTVNDGAADLGGILRAGVERALSGAHDEQTVTVNGRVYQILTNPVIIAGGRITGAVMVSLDITEKSQRDAMRHDFSSNVSHELKTPLTSIYGISELMMNGIVKPEDIAGFAKSIHDESGRLITLINDIMKLSQLDDNSFGQERQDVDLYDTARSALERLSPMADSRGITMSLKGAAVTVSGIPSILDEMIYNLCDNAVKYNVDGGRVTVSVAVIGGHPVVSVADTGIGIPPEHLDRVFERFYRVDKSHSKAIGGTGLGLSIVKHGAAYHGAEVTLKSRTGRGTVVTITF